MIWVVCVWVVGFGSVSGMMGWFVGWVVRWLL